MSRLCVVGPYIFEEGCETLSVTSNRYCEMLKNFLRPRLKEFNGSEDFRFQQDGATAHTARRSLGILREIFPSHLLTRRYRVARALARFDPLQFFPVGIPQGRGL